MIRLIGITIVLMALSACGSSSSSNGAGNTGSTATSGGFGGATTGGVAVGTLQFGGADTASIGNQMVAGYVGATAPTDSSQALVNIADNNNTITDIGLGQVSVIPVDEDNTATIQVYDGVTVLGGIASTQVTMILIKNGVEYQYLCTTLATPPTSDCGMDTVTVDVDAKMITFDNTLLSRASPTPITPTSITINGTVTWQ